MTKKRVIMIISIAIPLLLIAAVAIGGVFYSNKFLPNTLVNGVVVSGLTEEEVAIKFENTSKDSEFVFTSRDNEPEVFTVSCFDYKETLNKESIKKAKSSQLPIFWFVNLFRTQSLEVAVEPSFDEQKLNEQIGKLSCIAGSNIQEPVSAGFAREENQYVIYEEVQGNKVIPSLLKDKVTSIISESNRTIDVTNEDIYEKPKLTKAELETKGLLEKLNEVLGSEISYDFGGFKEVITPEEIESWIELDQDEYTFKINEESIGAHVQKVAETYDTLYKDRTFKTTNGKEITVGGGIYGWKMDVPKTTEKLVEKVRNLESGTVEPTYTNYGYTRGEGNDDIGNTYIEIDLGTQKMWLYKNGEIIVDTNIVSGLPKDGRETPTGVFTVWSKETKRYLSGDDYKLWVEYWMPIDWTGVGIHDATWQAKFGGDRYLVYGSHGCINTPPKNAGKIFDNIEEGIPVIVYS